MMRVLLVEDETSLRRQLAERLARLARDAEGNGPAFEGMRRRLGLEALVAAQVRVADARDAAQGNVNPQLLLATLGEDLAEVLA